MAVERRIIGGVARRIGGARLRRAPRPGWAEGTDWERLVASGLFDASWYLQMYPDVAATGIDPLWHFVSVGAAQGRDPNPLFSTRWYCKTYPDVPAVGLNPLLHYLDHGAKEGRDPSPTFNTKWYLDTNVDVRVAGANPLGHYLTSGEAEGRRPVAVDEERRSVEIALVSGEPQTPGHIYRVVRLAEALCRIGHTAHVMTIPEAAINGAAVVSRAAVVILWRAAWSEEVEAIVRTARRGGAVVVFDIDDLMVDPSLATIDVIDGIRSQGLTEEEAASWFSKVRLTAEAADYGFATTASLAATLRELGKPTWVIPNGHDDASWGAARLAAGTRSAMRSDGLIRLGYAAGSLTHQADFAVVAGAVADVLMRHPQTRLVLFRGAIRLEEFPQLDQVVAQIEWRDLVPTSQLPSELARFDVNLAPLEVGNPFCEAKSPLKMFEAALVDVPTVASPTAAFRQLIDHGVNGYLASHAGEWSDCLTRLVCDAQLRTDIGRRARASVEWTLGVDRRTQLASAVLSQIAGAPAEAAAAAELELRRALVPAPLPPTSAVPNAILCNDRLRPSLVTVAVPLRNYANFIAEALESVASQTLPDLDIVIVDDGSTDASLEVARDWLSSNLDRFNRALLVSFSDNLGLAQARNTAFALAETPYVLPLDADNILLREACDHLLALLEGGAAAFAYGRLERFTSDGTRPAGATHASYLPFSAQRFVGSNYIDALALIRRSAWLGAGGYQDGIKGWEDYDLWCRFVELGLHGERLAEDVARYRVHPSSMLHTTTDVGDGRAQVREAMARRHPWLHLEDRREVAAVVRDFPGRVPTIQAPPPPSVTVAPDQHVGNPLPERARRLVTASPGPILHMSGGGTDIADDRVTHLDLAVYGPTDVVADAHHLPFSDGTFELVLAVNAFEHYRNPPAVADEIRRVLRPGGIVYLQTAFLQPIHEAPHHYFNCTPYGLAEWMQGFDDIDVHVSDNFHPGFSLAWIASEAQQVLAEQDESFEAFFRASTLGQFADLWRDPSLRETNAVWEALAATSGDGRARVAAGFEYVGRAPS